MTDLPELRIEATAHVIGAFGDIPRNYGPNVCTILANTRDAWFELACNTDARWFMRLALSGFTPIGHEWLSVTAALSDMNGQPFGTRPALVYGEPYDIPAYTNFHTPRHDPIGHVSLGLRVVA